MTDDASRKAFETWAINSQMALNLERYMDSYKYAPTATAYAAYCARAAFIKAAMANHWLVAVHCNHEDKTDRAQCSCGEWRGKEMASVGEAVQDYCDHLLEQTL